VGRDMSVHACQRNGRALADLCKAKAGGREREKSGKADTHAPIHVGSLSLSHVQGVRIV
jgi:hypothetical protein